MMDERKKMEDSEMRPSGGCRRLGRLLDNGSFRKIGPEWREGSSKLEDSVGEHVERQKWKIAWVMVGKESLVQ